MIDYYRILGIEFGVDLEEIKKAYKKKALEFHPDKNNGEKYYEEKFIIMFITYFNFNLIHQDLDF